VSTTATARVRELSRGGRRKNDVIDAAAAASVAALQGDAVRVSAEDETTVFAMLEERRANVAAQRVRLTNQLHALLRDLVPGDDPLAVTAKSAAAVLGSVRPASSPERTRKELAQDLVRDLRGVDVSLTEIQKRMSGALDERGTRLRDVDGVGSITAARWIGRTGRASRFRSADSFATYTGVAPVEVASGDKQRHRLSRSGDRRLNSATCAIPPRLSRSRPVPTERCSIACSDNASAAMTLDRYGHLMPGQAEAVADRLDILMTAAGSRLAVEKAARGQNAG